MATIDWPSTLDLALVSGAPIREKGLVGWWSMNRTALDGSVLRDDSGSGNDGTIVGATPVDGVSGKALSFDGADDYVSIPYCPPDAGVQAISLWVKDFSAGLGSWIFTHAGGTANNRFYIAGTTGGLSFTLGAASVGTISPAGFSWSTWHHVVVVRDATNQKYEIYLDGTLRISGSYTQGTGDVVAVSGLAALSGIQNSVCKIDDLRIYNRALTADEVAALYARVTSYQALPEFPMPDGFSETVQDGALRSRSDSGLEKIRRRFTATPTLYSTRYQLTAEQKQLLDYFYRTTTRGGTLRFNWTHPHGYSVEARFRAPPVYTATDVEVIADVRLEVAA